MNYVDWAPQMAINAPAYLDANVLVGTIVNTHRLYPVCVQIIAQLLVEKVNVLISPITLSECLWATAKLAYCKITNNRPSANWNKTIYLRWCEKIFQSYEGWITAVGSMTKDWSSAGVPIEVVPKTQALWENAVSLAPIFMRQLKLSPADAIHLAFAQTHAKTFITADSDFDVIRNISPVGDLEIIHVVA